MWAHLFHATFVLLLSGVAACSFEPQFDPDYLPCSAEEPCPGACVCSSVGICLPPDGRDPGSVVVARDGSPLRAFADTKGVWRYPASVETVSWRFFIRRMWSMRVLWAMLYM